MQERFPSALKALLVLAAFLYLGFPTQQYYWDGVKFALRIETFPHSPAFWTDPNHLAFAPLGGSLWNVLDLVGMRISALSVLQLVGAAAGLLGVILFHELARMLSVSPFSRMVATTIFTFCASWWNYSVDVSSYVVTVTLLMLATLILFGRPPRWPFLFGAVLAAATLFHQMAVLYAVVPLTLIVVRKRDWKLLTGSLMGAGSISLAVQYAAYRLNPIYREPLPPGVVSPDGYPKAAVSGFVGWLLTHSDDSSFTWSLPSALSGFAKGTLKMFFGGKLIDVSFVPLSVLLATIFIAIFAIFLAWVKRARLCALAGSAQPKPFSVEEAERLLLMVVWIFAYVIFLFFWMPGNSFYRLFYLPPLILLAASALHSWFHRHPVAIITLVVLAITWNFLIYIYPRSRTNHNEPLVAAYRFQDYFDTGSKVFYRDFHTDNWLIRYINMDTHWFAVSSKESLPLGEEVWVDDSAWNWVTRDQSKHECIRFIEEARSVGVRTEIVFRKVQRVSGCLE